MTHDLQFSQALAKAVGPWTHGQCNHRVCHLTSQPMLQCQIVQLRN